MKDKIKFGYEVGTGKEVNINLAHTVITGLTQEAGKTTAIMGLIKRSGLKALIVKTKIGEKAISEGAVIPPFYREDFDWEYASEIMEASRKEKLKFERSWIIKYSKGASSLIEFKKNIDDALTNEKMRELEKSVLITLQAYLDKILPELSYAPLSKTLDLMDGINIMDLERFKEETQGLVIRSILNEVLAKDKNTIITLPESWKYIPEKYASPVKRPAESFIRQGATNKNFIWLDSQDITGVAKVILKQISNWILGRQTEINEIKRTIDQIPMNKKNKPKPEDVAKLKLGEFFVVTPESVTKCYAQPSWLDDETAKKVALGKLSVEDLEQPTHIAPYQIIQKEQPIEETDTGITNKDVEGIPKKINELRDDFISNRNDFFNKFEQINESIQGIQTELFSMKNQVPEKVDEDEVVARVLQKIPVNNSNGSSPINEEELISKIIARVPSGGNKVYEVAPLEKIKKDFLEEGKNKVLADVSKLGDRQKKMLKFIESQGKPCSTSLLMENCLLINAKSGSRNDVVKSLKEIENYELIIFDAKNGHKPSLKEKIEKYLSPQEAKPEEIEQVYNHILMEMLE